MARRRAPTTSAPSPAPTNRDPGEWKSVFPMRVVWISVGFLIGLAVYLVLFYSAEFGPGIPRYQPLGFLLVPDELVRDWFGLPLGEFALVDRLRPLVVAGGIGFFAFLLGWLVLPVLQAGQRLDRVEFFALATGLGLSALSLATLIIGLSGGLRRPLCFIVPGCLLLTLSMVRWWRRGAFPWRAPCSASDEQLDESGAISQPSCEPERVAWWWPRWWWWAIPFTLVILAGALLPPLDFDVLEYHLQVPREWYQQGRVTFLPHNVYGNMPLGAEMLATLAMALTPGDLAWWWGALSGKVVMASFTFLTSLLVFAAGRRYFSLTAGIVASLLYISTAWVVLVSVNGLNEGVLAYYLMASAYVGKLWWDRQRAIDTPTWGLVILAGWLAGSAVACKYTSLVLVVCPLFVVFLLGSRAYRVRIALVFLLSVIAACGLWFGKNWVLSGNPTYPLLVNVFGGETRTAAKDAQWRAAHRVPLNAQGNRYSCAQARDATVNLLGRSLWHNPLIVPFAALVFWRRGVRRELVYWGALLFFVLAAWWLLTHRLDRFWVPVLPLMVLLAGAGAAWSSSLVWRRVMWGVVACGLLANFTVISSPLVADNRYFVALEQLRTDPRMAAVPGSQRLIAHAYLRQHVPPGSCALLVGDAAAFDLPTAVLYNTCFDDCIFEQIFRSGDAATRRARLRALHISHIYIDWAEIARYRQPGNYGFSDFVTRELVHEELQREQQLVRRIRVPGLDPQQGEIYAVLPRGKDD